MLLTIFYMMATWIQAWRLASLKARLAVSLVGPEASRPTIMFFAKSPNDPKNDLSETKETSKSENGNFLSSRLCRNQNVARLGDLIWCQGDKKLCTIYPQQKIEVNEWLTFPRGKTQFPLHVQNHGQTILNDSTKMHVLIEADAESYHPMACAKATKVEDYGKVVTWTMDENFAAILETDLDHMTKLSIALMHGKCFINNGFLLTRVESIAVTGKPCVYNCEEIDTLHQDKKLVGKARWDAHIKILKIFSTTARHVAQQGVSLEVDEVPGVLVEPGNQPVNLHVPTVLEIQIPEETSADPEQHVVGADERVVAPNVSPPLSSDSTTIGMTGSPATSKTTTFAGAANIKKFIGTQQLFGLDDSGQPGVPSDDRFATLPGDPQPEQVTASPVRATKKWHQTITNDFRNHIVYKLVQTIHASPDDPRALLDKNAENAVAYARKFEKDMYEMANSRSEYCHLIADKTCEIQKELDLKCRNDATVPSTPPPTPASAIHDDGAIAARISHSLTKLVEQNSGESFFSSVPAPNSPVTLRTNDLTESQNITTPQDTKDRRDSTESPIVVAETSSTAASVRTPQQMFSTSTSHYSPAKKPPSNFNCSIKPPNILIYADSSIATDNIKNVLGLTLNKDKYTIYTLTPDEARRDVWMDQTVLVVVCGNVGAEVSCQLVEYMVRGGQLLALCSDTLHTLLPSFKTAEVREHELVRFSYGKWKHVQMMHHIFCYQASPVKTQFSQDHEDSRGKTPHTPVSANVLDSAGKMHTFHVKVLGTEETWHTPSILLANLPESGGRAVFSQIHFEADPSQYEFEETKFNALKQSDTARLEIFSDLLTTHFGLDAHTGPREMPKYSPGFFLGRHELKLEMLDRLRDKTSTDDIYKTAKMSLQFCGRTTKSIAPSPSLLPIMIHQCPDNFSTVEYFENLKSKELGRLVIYADLMTSSMNVVSGCQLHHGLAVIPRQQSQGQGRTKNVWLSPMGCAMFTMQLHVPLNSELGSCLSILQHLVAVAVVSAIKSIPGYENIDLRLKWPNDIYAGSTTKIGGLIVTTLIESSIAICNIGLGVNLSNSVPTCCINDVIAKYNEQNGLKLSKISYERFLALVFTELENLFIIVQNGNMAHLFELYYNYWMHTDTEITVETPDGKSQQVQIMGIDRYGFLEVRGKNGKVFTVHPDGNSFDILKGLISPLVKV